MEKVRKTWLGAISPPAASIHDEFHKSIGIRHLEKPVGLLLFTHQNYFILLDQLLSVF